MRYLQHYLEECSRCLGGLWYSTLYDLRVPVLRPQRRSCREICYVACLRRRGWDCRFPWWWCLGYEERIGRLQQANSVPCLTVGDWILRQVLKGRAVVHEERKITGPQGDITISIIRSMAGQSSATNYPRIFYTHSGVIIAGNRFLGIGVILD